jgi:selenocysteine lyase/cysteine desulfurase
MLGLKGGTNAPDIPPVVFVTHMEHHSNQTSWEETSADVVIIPKNEQGLPDLNFLQEQTRKFAQDGRIIYGSITACSNVTGILTDYHLIAQILHEVGGKCFVDFAASAPYVDINMHPENPDAKLDAIFMSPHKCLGGPGSSGVIVFDKSLYKNKLPDDIGGGIVSWTNPWREHGFYNDIETRESAGTPGILQAYTASLALGLKQQMSPEMMKARKAQLLKRAFEGLGQIDGIHILEANNKDRQGIVSFVADGVHYALMVTLLSDMFGIQARGGCSCAGTYGHILFGIDQDRSHQITSQIDSGDNTCKPGWVRFSLHPTMTDRELEKIIGAVECIMQDKQNLKALYSYNPEDNVWTFKDTSKTPKPIDPSTYFF